MLQGSVEAWYSKIVVSSKTFWPLNIRPLHCLELLGSDYPLSQYYMPEEQDSLHNGSFLYGCIRSCRNCWCSCSSYSSEPTFKTSEMNVKMVDWMLLLGCVTGHMGDGMAPPADSCVIPWVLDTCHLALQVISNLTTMAPSLSSSVHGWNFLKPYFIHTFGYLASGRCAMLHSEKNKSGELHLFPSSGEKMESI